MSKIPLYGFNNLTKSLSFSLYKLHYLNSPQSHHNYNAHINTRFSADNLTILLDKICHTIGGSVLNIAKQDYQPQGASVTLMMSEEAQPTSLTQTIVAHLDKSHLCIHTYPEEVPHDNIAIFRADIELSTCGVISPLKVLNYVIEVFDADVVDIDYRVRGMTRNLQGIKQFNDQIIENISDHLSVDVTKRFHIKNHNLAAHNLFHTKLCRQEVNLNKHLFELTQSDLTDTKKASIANQLQSELQQIFTKSR
ncbi:MAG: adenosylmethionine decarboxylase [Colwellia sp.]|nr:adenosylmethionine decarboxylase [Colwellia sp.]